MAQRTSYLNSDAIGFNKDFHHTAIFNYLLSNVGIMFSDLETKPEFTLGNGTITGGGSIVKCTRTTGTFSGKEILALFESTITETIDTTGNKKVYIEIAQSYIDNSSTITDALTGGINENVGEIKSTVNYPTHTNYIPLREITGGNWAGAVDVRPAIKRFGHKNTVSYYDDNGEEQIISLDASSINKFLRSNGSGNAPTFEDPAGSVEVKATKNRYIAGEDLLKTDIITNNPLSTFANAITEINIGDSAGNTRREFRIIGNGQSNSDINLSLKQTGSPSDNFVVRIETDSAGDASGTLIHANAEGILAGSGMAGTLTDEIISRTGAFTIPDGTVCHLVLQRSGSVSGTNYYTVGVENRTTRTYLMKTHDGASRGASSGINTPYINCDGVFNNLRVKAKADDSDLKVSDGICIADTTIGNEFVADVTGTSDVFTTLETVKYYLSNTAGQISTAVGSGILIGRGLSSTDLKIGSEGAGGKGRTVGTGGDYTTIDEAIDDGAKELTILSNQTTSKAMVGFTIILNSATIRITINTNTLTDCIFKYGEVYCRINRAKRCKFIDCEDVTDNTSSLAFGNFGEKNEFIMCDEINLSSTGNITPTYIGMFHGCQTVNVTSTDNGNISLYDNQSCSNTRFIVTTSGTILISGFINCRFTFNSCNDFRFLNMIGYNYMYFANGGTYIIDVDRQIGNNYMIANSTSDQITFKGTTSGDNSQVCNNTLNCDMKFEDIDGGMLCNNMANGLIASTGCTNTTEVNNSSNWS